MTWCTSSVSRTRRASTTAGPSRRPSSRHSRSYPFLSSAPHAGVMTSRFTRRASLLRFLGLAAAAGGGAAWKLQSADGAGPLAVSSGAVACVLTPELTEGPYYVSGERLRRNVTEGKKGMLLLLKLSVLNVSTCKPIQNATVEIWHCDAKGVYSGAVANNSGTNFLRGAQRTNASGVATFQTIYPGW